MNLPRPAKILIGLVLLACLLATSFLLLRNEGSADKQTTTDAYITADFVFIASKVAGTVSQVFVEDNQKVRKGQLLATLDDRDFLVALASAQADLSNAQADVERLQASIVQQQSVVTQASAALLGDDASITFAQANSRRYANLSTDGSGTLQEKQQADSQLQIARANRLQHSAARDAAQHQTAVLHAQEKQAEALITKAQAALDAARLNLAYTKIGAPVDGTVGQRTVRAGAYTHVGAPLLAIVPLEQAFVEANFRETQLERLRPGQRVDIKVDMLSGAILRGRVQSVAPASGIAFSPVAPDNATGNFTKVVQRLPVKIILDPHQPDASRLRVGMSVVPTVDVATAPANLEVQ